MKVPGGWLDLRTGLLFGQKRVPWIFSTDLFPHMKPVWLQELQRVRIRGHALAARRHHAPTPRWAAASGQAP